MNIEETLDERSKTHGDWGKQSLCAKTLKNVMRSDGLDVLAPTQAEALDMIATKISRILCGNPNDTDHWRDIAGYATLAAKAMENEK